MAGGTEASSSARSGTRGRAWSRWALALVIGGAIGLGVGAGIGVAAGILAAWGMLALTLVCVTLREVWPMRAEQTRAHASIEDPGRRVARVIAIFGSVISLVAVAVVAVQARSASGAEAYLLAGTAVLSVVSSWLLIQTDYLLHYAREYYREGEDGEPVRGIDFNQPEDPEYTDFAYFSIGLGLTYQVSDTDLSSNAIRRIVIAQTLLAYVFGAGILATVINLVASLG